MEKFFMLLNFNLMFPKLTNPPYPFNNTIFIAFAPRELNVNSNSTMLPTSNDCGSFRSEI